MLILNDWEIEIGMERSGEKNVLILRDWEIVLEAERSLLESVVIDNVCNVERGTVRKL